MNNNYDRDDSAPGTVVIDTEAAEPVVGLFLLKSGETVISRYTTDVDRSSYVLEDPRAMMIEGAGGDGTTTSTTVAYADWMPLAQDRTFTVSADWVVTASRPLDSLVESYLSNTNG